VTQSTAEMMDITERDFDREVLKCKLPVFACFTTKWCHSCYPTCLFADELVKEYDGSVKFVRLDTEKSPEIAERYHVKVVPTILLFKDSQPVEKLLGFQDHKSLRRLLGHVIAKEPGADRIKEIEDKIADLKARWPAHSVPPLMWQQLEELEEELERAKKAEKRS
jgi:thioredoxin 1